MPIPRKLKCWTGPMNDHQTGLIIAYSQRQSENLLKMGHHRFLETWVLRDVPPPPFVQYVSYVRSKDFSGPDLKGWVARKREL